MKYYIIAGEASGDLHAANLMHELRKYDSDAQFRFFGGDLMLAEGGTLVKHYKEMAYMGFIPVLMNLRTILSNMQFCKNDIRVFSPDVVILVDYPGFNLKIAKFVKTQLNLPVYYYISPKIWAWKEYRIKSIKKYIDKMLVIFPFEVEFYQKHQYKVDYIGNPTVDELAQRSYKEETFENFTENNSLEKKSIIAILPGSRKQEIPGNLPEMLNAVSCFSDYQLIIAGAPGISPDFYQQISEAKNIPVIFNQTYRLLQQATLALVTSGTATLETALLRVPQVVCYKVGGGRFTYWASKTFLHIDFISLVNLIAEKEVVKELIAHLFSADVIRKEVENILYDKDYRTSILEGYEDIIRKLGPAGASDNAAKLIVDSFR